MSLCDGSSSSHRVSQERLERDVERLSEQAVASNTTGERLADEVRRLEARLGAIERLCAHHHQKDPLIEELRSKLQELTILTYVT